MEKKMQKSIKYSEPFNVVTHMYDLDNYVKLNVPIKMWLSEIETGTLDQYYNIARLPFAFKHIAAMPDSHLGYGMPIGGVLAAKGYVIPNAVGVDIGCGMISLRTSLTEIATDILEKIKANIRKLIPVGFKHNKKPQGEMPQLLFVRDGQSICEEQYESAKNQLGTLGGGNHFIEIQKGNDGYIHIMVHSGSRNLGKRVADHYNKLAVEKNKEWCSQVPKKWELAFLPVHSDYGRRYLNEMSYCVKFAYANRLTMIDKVKEAFHNHIDTTFYDFELVNIPHNFANIENHFGQNVVVHRKGATQAYKDQLGIIPGSQGSHSYIVRGKGNTLSFMSCSHGAGRAMGIKQAQKNLILKDEQKKLDDQNILHSIHTKKDLGEATGAYKNIIDVMSHQTDLIDVVTVLTPLATIKG